MKIRDAIYLLLNRFTDLACLEEVQHPTTVSVSGGGYLDVYIPLPEKEGYIPVAIMGYNLTAGALRASIVNIVVNTNTVRIRAYNTSSGTINPQPIVKVMYMKTAVVRGGGV